MTRYQKETIIEAEPAEVYRHCIALEEHPRWMGMLKQVERLGEDRYRWTMELGAFRRQWEGEIIDEAPGAMVRWASTPRGQVDCTMILTPVRESCTALIMDFDYTPASMIESLGESMGLIDEVLGEELENFRRYIERNSQPLKSREVGAPTVD